MTVGNFLFSRYFLRTNMGKWSIKSSILIVFMAMAISIWGWSANAGNSITIEEEDKEEEVEKKVDDWQFEPNPYDFGLGVGASFSLQNKSIGFSTRGAIGFSTGGAKDINNFRENIKNNFLPLPSDVTYEGLFYDYFFDTGLKQPCRQLFCPSYAAAMSKDPFSKKGEYFLSVGLNSGIQQKDFSRKKLNLIIVLDISGSMSSPFDRYYYDQFKKEWEPERGKGMGKKQKCKWLLNRSLPCWII